jgi:peptidoglycan/xylan/chitin deacetylase (PgdA/CDA1 family)
VTARLLKAVYDGVAGHPAVASRLGRLVAPDESSILLYHGLVAEPLPVGDGCFLEVDDFRRQMEYLASRCRVVPLGEIPRTPEGAGGKTRVAITFDDGFRSVRDLAGPVLRSLGLPATVFLATGFTGSGATPWFCHVHRALIATRRESLEWRGRTIGLGSPGSRAAASASLQGDLKELAPGEIPAALDRLAGLLDVAPPGDVPPESPWRMLDAESVAGMDRDGLFDFGAHTRGHAILARMAGAERAEEIRVSVRAVAALTGRPCRTFAYPNGRAGDFSGDDVAVLKEEGISMAVTTEPGGVRTGADPWRLSRYHIASGVSFATFVATVHNLRRRAGGAGRRG